VKLRAAIALAVAVVAVAASGVFILSGGWPKTQSTPG